MFLGSTCDLSPTPPPLPELTINGHRYVLAPAAEAVAEVPEVKAGQVWRDSVNEPVLIGRVGEHLYQAVSIMATRANSYWDEPYSMEGLKRRMDAEWQFVAPSLADALASGALTADMLRGES